MSEQAVPPTEDERTTAERWARAHYTNTRRTLVVSIPWEEIPESVREAEIAAMLPLVREARAKAANMAADVGELRAALAFEKAWNKETIATVPRMERLRRAVEAVGHSPVEGEKDCHDRRSRLVSPDDVVELCEAMATVLSAARAASAPLTAEIDAEDLWTDYRTERTGLGSAHRLAFLAGVDAGRRTSGRPAPDVWEDGVSALLALSRGDIPAELRPTPAAADQENAFGRALRTIYQVRPTGAVDEPRPWTPADVEGIALRALSACSRTLASRIAAEILAFEAGERGDIPADVDAKGEAQ